MSTNPQRLAQRVRKYFEKLEFEHISHTYHVEGKAHTSVSRMIDNFVDKPDFEAIAGYIAKRDGGTQQEILDGWAAHNKAACDRGHRIHLFAEGDMCCPVEDEEFAVVKFWEDLDRKRYIVIAKELRMYHRELGYAGTLDLLLYDTELEGLVIDDYKTNADLFKNFKGKTLEAPFDDLEDSPYNKYQIQLSLYQILLEQLGIPIVGRNIIWLVGKDYNTFPLYDLTQRLRTWLN